MNTSKGIKNLDDCPQPVIIEKEDSPNSQLSTSPDRNKDKDGFLNRLRKSSWDDSDGEWTPQKQESQETTGRIYSADKSKNNQNAVEKIKEVYLQSVDDNNEEKIVENVTELSDRRHSPARIRRRRKSSSGSSIISDNALDDRIQEIKQVNIDDKIEEVSNVESTDSINTIKKLEEPEKRVPTPKKLPPVELSSAKKKNCVNPEIFQEISKNISNLFLGKPISSNESKGKRKNSSKKNKENVRAKSNELERRSKNMEKNHENFRPKSEKINLIKTKAEMTVEEYPKPLSPIILTPKTSNSETSSKISELSNKTIREIPKENAPKVEFEILNVRKSSGRPKSANFLIMEDLEDMNVNDMCKESTAKTERTKSADCNSDATSKLSSYFERNKDSEDSTGKSFTSSAGSKISDIHNWSEKDVKFSPKTVFESEKWCHNFEELYRTEKSPYSERGQLTSPSDSTGKSANSEYTWKNSGKMDTSTGVSEKPQSRNIEEPQDHGDGNFKLKNSEEIWERLISQMDEKQLRKYNQEIKRRFGTEEMFENTEKRCWLSDIEEEKPRKFSEESHSPKNQKSKWSLVNSASDLAKPMSSSSDASVQCIIQEKITLRPRKRKRERCQNKEHSRTLEKEKLIIRIPNFGTEKKEVAFDFNEINICQEGSEETNEHLIRKISREKQTTNFKNFLVKNGNGHKQTQEAKTLKNKSDTIKLTLKGWKNQSRKKNNSAEKISEDECETSREDFSGCDCFQVFYRFLRNIFGASR